MICSVILIFSIYSRYEIGLKREISMDVYTEFDDLQNTGLWKWLLWECIVHILIPYAFLDGVKYKEYVVDYDLYITYEINDLLLAFSFIRIIYAFRNILYLSMFCN